MTLQYAILGILTNAPVTGYLLGKIFNGSVNYAWTASLSQIYRELSKLEKDGYVSSSIEHQDEKPDKKVYSITKKGDKFFTDWLHDFPETTLPGRRDEFMVRIFFGAKLGKSKLIEQFEKFIYDRENFRKTIAEDKKIAKDLRKDIGKADSCGGLCMQFVTRRAKITNEALIAWAQECIEELKKESAG